ncbi:MAG: ATP phosphoribosyltransferase regulatory subunit, partial [Candidatus Doudnabacteria bacterium]|nr:ATP phosphoribosyltransferase regulatory subunit [Candidatus Doudnabacteria bacterium]
MMTKIEARTLKGFRDYAPQEQLARQQMFAKIQSVFERFGFLPLSTPALEYKEILLGKYGDEEKLVYSFKDNGDRDVALRYDLTVPF